MIQTSGDLFLELHPSMEVSSWGGAGAEKSARSLEESDFLLPANGGTEAPVQMILRKPSKYMG